MGKNWKRNLSHSPFSIRLCASGANMFECHFHALMTLLTALPNAIEKRPINICLVIEVFPLRLSVWCILDAIFRGFILNWYHYRLISTFNSTDLRWRPYFICSYWYQYSQLLFYDPIRKQMWNMIFSRFLNS